MCKDAKEAIKSAKRRQPTWFEREVGCAAVSVFTLCYYNTVIYLFGVVVAALYFGFGIKLALYCLPAVVSMLLPPIPLPGFLATPFMKCLPKYFDYELIAETPNEVLFAKGKRPYILACQPHGVVSVAGFCWAVSSAPLSTPPTAVASALLATPILKHFLGIFNIVDASSKSLTNMLVKKKQSVVLYVGGMAELFLSSPKEEKLFISQRKGFIKLALKTGCDVVPIYFFGNTASMEIVQAGWLSTVSRKLGISVTLTWGRWGLPIPRATKVVSVSGKPLGIPSEPNDNPSNEDIDKWHKLYCDEVVRIFNQYKHMLPDYKDKELILAEETSNGSPRKSESKKLK